ncbi:MAG: hypothetical protein KC502_17830 [Myxococcales bacterium]|nr:hypothetical protein [Myxococcales bacterium]
MSLFLRRPFSRPTVFRGSRCTEMTRPDSRPSWRLVGGGLAVIAFVVGGCGAAAPTYQPLTKGTIELGETRPVETKWGPRKVLAAHMTWLGMIGQAKTHIDLGQFYIANRPNSHLDRVIVALEAAATRGVAVRVLVDSKFARKYPKTLARLAAGKRITVRRLDVGAHMGGVLHAKYFIIDRQTGWLGSQNFDWRSLTHIHELGVRFRIPVVVAAMLATFEADWALAVQPVRAKQPATAKSPQPLGAPAERPTQAPRITPPVFNQASWRGQPVQVAAVGSPLGHLPQGLAWELPPLVRWIDDAKAQVSVQLLSMHRRARDGSHFPVLFDALVRAAKRGVQVQVMVSNWSKSRRSAAELSELQKIPNLTVRYVTFPQHSKGFIPFARVIHSKFMVVDATNVWIGTSNWSKGYFHTSRNVGVLVMGSQFATALDRLFAGLWGSKYAETLVPGKRYPKQRIAR